MPSAFARKCAAATASAVLIALPRIAHAQQFPTWTIGVEPRVGAGVAAFTHAAPLPKFVGVTALGVELRAEFDAWGGFVRGDYFSSGEAGRWTAPAILGGVSRRLVGDGVEHVAIVPHVAIEYARWHGSNGGCPIALFVPSSCIEEIPPPSSGVIAKSSTTIDSTTDTLGLDLGARLEVPTRGVYLAFDSDISASAPFESTAPGAAFQFTVAVVLAFRDVRATLQGSPSTDQRTFRRF